MDKTTKTVLIFLASLLVVCACVTAAAFAAGLWSYSRFVSHTERTISQSPQVTVRVGSDIADYEVPAGFGSPYSVHFGDVTLIGYQSASENSHLLLAQFPEGTDMNEDEMLRLIEQVPSDPNRSWSLTGTTLVDRKPVTIRGQQAMLLISDGTAADGILYRSATAAFEGRGGPSLVMIAGPLDEWDMDMVEEFLSSIE